MQAGTWSSGRAARFSSARSSLGVLPVTSRTRASECPQAAPSGVEGDLGNRHFCVSKQRHDPLEPTCEQVSVGGIPLKGPPPGSSPGGRLFHPREKEILAAPYTRGPKH